MMIEGDISCYGDPPPDSTCHLCGTKSRANTLIILGVSPAKGQLMGSNVVICGKCIIRAVNNLPISEMPADGKWMERENREW